MVQDNKETEVTLNEKSLEILVTKFIPTSQYFERSFEVLQIQIDGLREGQKELKSDIDKRFEQVDKRFEQVDKRFEQVDKRFEQVDKRFEQADQALGGGVVGVDRRVGDGGRAESCLV